MYVGSFGESAQKSGDKLDIDTVERLFYNDAMAHGHRAAPLALDDWRTRMTVWNRAGTRVDFPVPINEQGEEDWKIIKACDIPNEAIAKMPELQGGICVFFTEEDVLFIADETLHLGHFELSDEEYKKL